LKLTKQKLRKIIKEEKKKLNEGKEMPEYYQIEKMRASIEKMKPVQKDKGWDRDKRKILEHMARLMVYYTHGYNR